MFFARPILAGHRLSHAPPGHQYRTGCHWPAPAALTDLTTPWARQDGAGLSVVWHDCHPFSRVATAVGEERWQAWCRALQANRPFLVDGNSVVVNLVGRGEAWIGLTDSDDIAAGRRDGLPIAELPLTGEP